MFNFLLEEIFFTEIYYTNTVLIIVLNSVLGFALITIGALHSLFRSGENFNKEDYLNPLYRCFYLRLYLLRLLLVLAAKVTRLYKSETLTLWTLLVLGLALLFEHHRHLNNILALLV